MRTPRLPSILRPLTSSFSVSRASSSTSRHASSIAADAPQSDGKDGRVDEEWRSILKSVQHKQLTDHPTSPQAQKSRVQLLLERASRLEDLNERDKDSKVTALAGLEETINFDDVGLDIPANVRLLYENILNGQEEIAWDMFRQVIDKGLQGEPSASIWHWYFMVGLVARDRTVPIGDVLRMASNVPTLNFQESDVHQSLKNPDELGGVVGQQRILAFTLMHNLRKRMTTDAYKAVLRIWDCLLATGISPSSRHINAMCVTLIHMGRHDDAMKRLFTLMTSGAPSEDASGWMTCKERGGAQMSKYTAGMVMYAFLLEGYPKRAYEKFKASINDQYAVPMHCVRLNLLLWAGKHSYESIASCQAMEDGDHQADLHESGTQEGRKTKNVEHWRGQAIWDGYPSVVQARHIFLTYLFRQHPELKTVTNPLYEAQTGKDGGIFWKTHARMQQWSHSLTNIINPFVRWHMSQGDAVLLTVPTGGEMAEEDKLKVDQNTFDYYLDMLPYVSAFEEVPWEEYVLVLAWMKQLDILPGPYCLLRICWALDHLVPPVAEFASCAGPLHDYLADWIGEEKIPARDRLDVFVKNQRHG